MHRTIRHLSIGALVIVGLTVAVPPRAVAQQPATRSLYDRLGGVYSIATVVDDFIERLLVNQTLNANPAINEARGRVPKAGLKFHVTALVCEVTGGPCRYTGRTMQDAHERLNITEAQWQAMVTDFRKTLDTFKVPPRDQAELVTIVESTKKDIVKPAPDVADRALSCSIDTAPNDERTSAAKKSTRLSIASSLNERRNPPFQ